MAWIQILEVAADAANNVVAQTPEQVAKALAAQAGGRIFDSSKAWENEETLLPAVYNRFSKSNVKKNEGISETTGLPWVSATYKVGATSHQLFFTKRFEGMKPPAEALIRIAKEGDVRYFEGQGGSTMKGWFHWTGEPKPYVLQDTAAVESGQEFIARQQEEKLLKERDAISTGKLSTEQLLALGLF